MAQNRIAANYLFSPEISLKLFMICAFPLHIWTLLMAFRDFGWVAARTCTWDAIGLVSYALVVALLESIAVFVLVWLIGFLVPFRWDLDKRLAMLGAQFLVVASWSILSKIYTAFDSPLPVWLSNFMLIYGHPLRILWGIAAMLVFLSTVAPALLIMKLVPATKVINSAFDRIVVLSSFYVVLDLIGVIIIVIRNIH